MGSFKNYYKNDSQRLFFESHYEDVSEPLKEYTVGDNDSLYQTATSETLLGVKKNGKWGWVDSNNMFVIQPEYDSGFVTCFNGIITLAKNRSWGGIYRKNGSVAFSFRYNHLSHAYGETHIARNSNDKCALIKPVDRMLTNYSYIGFLENNGKRITGYVKSGFFGVSRGYIDLETGREL